MSANPASTSARPTIHRSQAAQSDSTPVDFDDVYRMYHPKLVRFARRQGAIDPEGAADLALLDGYRALDRLRSDDAAVLEAYLFKATRSHVLREGRQRRETPMAVTDRVVTDQLEHQVAESLDVQSLLDELPRDQREVIELRFLEDLTAAETGERLGKSPGAVRQLQLRALRRMRRLAFLVAVVAVVAAVWAAAVFFSGRLADLDVDVGPADSPVDERPAPDRPSIEEESDETSQPQLPAPPTDGPAVRTISAETFEPINADDAELNPDGDVDIDSAPELVPDEAPVAPVIPNDILAYDGFDLGNSPYLGSGLSALGFADDTAWTVIGGTVAVEHEPVGLSYTDAGGTQLATVPGAIRLRDISGTPQLSRRAYPGSTFHAAYYVSFLVRSDGAAAGDLFWSPDGLTHQGGGGLADDARYRLIDDPVTSELIEPGQTALIVIHIRPEPWRSQMYVNPNLLSPLPQATASDVAAPMADSLIFALSDRNRGTYTLDEIRFGRTFRSVTPLSEEN